MSDVFQINLLNLNKEKKLITKPIRLIECFAGIGSQYRACEILGVPFESWKIVEWTYNSFRAYNAIHIKDHNDYSKGKTKEELIEKLKGISVDYNKPLSFEKLNKKPLAWLQDAYNNCIATHNLIDISNVHGKDLEIKETEKYEYILTYSFPCQDLSLSGKMAGMQKGKGTRSGLLWEVERILDELAGGGLALPQILICENVPQLISKKNISDYAEWIAKLDSLGYQSFPEILNGKDYGIPQNRRRCIIVSILGDHAYDIPLPFELKYHLSDFLEEEVNEKYFLSEQMLNYLLKEETGGYKRKEWFLRNIKESDRECAWSLTTRQGRGCCDNYILIKNATKQGYLKAEVGDGVDVSGRMQYHRGTVQKGLCQTIKTQIDVGVVVEKLKTKELWIRNLTPCESVRLMGFTDNDYQAMRGINMGDGAIYHVAGDSIITTVLANCIGQMLPISTTELKEITQKYVESIIHKN